MVSSNILPLPFMWWLALLFTWCLHLSLDEVSDEGESDTCEAEGPLRQRLSDGASTSAVMTTPPEIATDEVSSDGILLSC